LDTRAVEESFGYGCSVIEAVARFFEWIGGLSALFPCA
jgi:hypothetical protein